MAFRAKAAAKKSRASKEQLRVMVDLLSETEGLASGKFQRLHGKLEHQKKWGELAEKLNALGGASKNVDQWNTVWRDLKRRTSNHVRDLNNEKAQTGNRPISLAPLSDMEMRIVDLIGDNYVEGAEICIDSALREEEVQLDEEEDIEILWSDEENVEGIPLTPHKEATTPRVTTATPRATTATPRVTTATPRATKATPRANTATPRPGLKRKRGAEEYENDRARFLEIADKQADTLRLLAENQGKQADTLRLLAENQAKQADAMLAMANAISTMGEGLKACADAINGLSQAMKTNNFINV